MQQLIVAATMSTTKRKNMTTLPQPPPTTPQQIAVFQEVNCVAQNLLAVWKTVIKTRNRNQANRRHPLPLKYFWVVPVIQPPGVLMLPYPPLRNQAFLFIIQ